MSYLNKTPLSAQSLLSYERASSEPEYLKMKTIGNSINSDDMTDYIPHV